MTREMLNKIESDYWEEKADPIDMTEVFDLANKALEQEPTVKAIPVEKVEQIKNRLEKMPFYFVTTINEQTIKTVDVDKVIKMLDEAIKEQNG